jgi:hypothetical protein
MRGILFFFLFFFLSVTRVVSAEKVGDFGSPDAAYPFVLISELNAKGASGIFNTEGYVVKAYFDASCAQFQCAGGPTAYMIISEDPMSPQPLQKCSPREMVLAFPTDFPVTKVFKEGRRYKFTLDVAVLDPRDTRVYHYPELQSPAIIGRDILGTEML